jgi:hypothetical protein
MPNNQERIDDFVDLKAVRSQVEKAIEQIERLSAAIKNIRPMVISVQEANNFKETKKGLEDIAKAQMIIAKSTAEMGESVKQYQKIQQKGKEITDDEIKANLEAKEAMRQRIAAIKEQMGAQEKLNYLQSVPFTNNLSQLEKENQVIKGTAEAVSDLDKAQGQLANSASVWAESSKAASEEVKAIGETVPEITLAYDAYTGSLQQNLSAQIENNIQLDKNKAEQKEIQKAIRDSGSATDQQIRRLAELKQESLLLSESNSKLTQTIKNQSKEFLAEGGSIDEMRAKLNLLQQSYEQLSAVEKAAPFGMEIKGQIDVLDPALKKAEEGIGKTSRQVGSYTSAIQKSFSGAFGYLRQIANILPGIGIAGIIGWLSDLAIEFYKWATSSKEVVTQTKILRDVTREAADAYGRERAQLDGLVGALQTEGISRKEKMTILKELQEKYPGYFDNIKNEKDLNNDLADAYERATKGILLKAKAQAAGDMIGKNYAEQLKAEQDYYQEMEEHTEFFNKYWAQAKSQGQGNIDIFMNSYQTMIDNTVGKYEEKVTEVSKKNDILLKSIQQSNAGIEKLGGKTTGKKDANEKDDHQAEKDLQAEFQTYRAQQERLAALAKVTAEDEKSSYQERLMALGQYVRIKQNLVAAEGDLELRTKKLSSKEKIAIERSVDDEQIRIAQDSGEILSKIQDDYLKNLKKNNKDLVSEYGTTYEKLHSLLQDYLKKRQEAEAKANKKSAEDIHKEMQARTKELADELKGLSFDLLEGGVTKRMNALQAEQDLKDQNYAKEIENINNSTLSEQDKAAKIKILEAEKMADAEKYDRKKRELDEKRARFEKAKAVADIIESTAIAVISALGAKPWTAANIALAAVVGAIGAAQIARVIAQPIPHYSRGVDSHPGGPAIVGEVGQELVRTPSGKEFLTPGSATLMNLERGSKVIPHDKLNSILHQRMMQSTLAMMGSPVREDSTAKELKELKGMVAWQTEELKKAYGKQKSRTVINNRIDTNWGSYLEKNVYR